MDRPASSHPDMETVLRQAEDGICNLTPNEVGIAFDQDGNEVLRKLGGPGYVSFAPDELRLLRDNILTHNHPNGRSFSTDDVVFAVHHNLAEIRATGVNDLGEAFLYSQAERGGLAGDEL